MNSAISDRRDVLLLLLYSPGRIDRPNESISGRTRLVKMLFLFREEVLPHFRKGTALSTEAFYEFFPWSFGPFSTQVYDDLTFFALRGFLESSTSDEEPLPESAAEWEKWVTATGSQDTSNEVDIYEEESFVLTDRGCNFAKRLYDSLSESQRKLLKEFKRRLARAPLRGILRYVYETYPGLTEKSTIKEDVLA